MVKAGRILRAQDAVATLGERRVIGSFEARQREQAEQILERAEADAQRIRQRAEAEREAERRRGYEEGHARGLAETMEKVWTAQQRWVQQVEDSKVPIARLACAIARKVIDREIDGDSALLADLVAQAMVPVRQEREITIRVHPDDHAALEQQKPRLLAAVARAPDIVLKSDAQVERHGCLVETAVGVIDGQLSSQLRLIEDSLVRVEGV